MGASEGDSKHLSKRRAAKWANCHLPSLPTPAEVALVSDENMLQTHDDETRHAKKSVMNQVLEIALTRKLAVNFEVTKECGLAHMPTFLTQCTCGELSTHGDGNSKRLSKRRAAKT